jgi:peptide/nickel transport system substrate-binding protein
LTAVFNFKRPAPKWHHFISYKFDIGIHIVPEHVYNGKDWTEFRDFDLDKGWPLSTGPWRVVEASPEQIIFDRADSSDWWASRQGYWKYPQVERFIMLPLVGGATQAAQSLVKNEIDTAGPGGLLSVPLHEEIQSQNSEIVTHNLREKPYGFLNWYTATIEIDNSVAPFDDKNVRWAISLSLDRQKMIDVAFKGAGSISRVPWPAFAGLQPFTEAIEPLLAKYRTDAYDPAEAASRLKESGYAKNADGMWEKDGETIQCEIIGYSSFAAQGPVIAELLRNEGIDATFSMPPDFGTRRATGDYTCATAGHGGSVGDDPFFTFRLYLSQFSEDGSGEVNVYRYANKDFDAVIEEMAGVPNTDQDELKRLTVKAMEIWLDELPDAQLHDFYQAPAINTCYWENWPSYANGRQGMSGTGHLTYNLALYELEATGGC